MAQMTFKDRIERSQPLLINSRLDPSFDSKLGFGLLLANRGIENVIAALSAIWPSIRTSSTSSHGIGLPRSL